MKIGTSARGKLNNQIHREMRRIAIRRHPYCVCCGAYGGENFVLQGGHLIPKKSSTATRFDLMNVFTQCRHCNFIHQFNSHIFIGWFINEYGTDEYLNLVERSKKVKQYKIADLKELLEEYKKI